MSKTQKVTVGVGGLFGVMVLGKLFGWLDWSWWTVMFPVWGSMLVGSGFMWGMFHEDTQDLGKGVRTFHTPESEEVPKKEAYMTSSEKEALDDKINNNESISEKTDGERENVHS